MCVGSRGRRVWGRQGETQIEGWSPSRSGKGRPHVSFLWAHLCTLSQGIGAWRDLASDILVLSPQPLIPALGRDGYLLGSPDQRASRESLGWPCAPELPSLSASGCSTRWLLPSVSAAGCVPVPNCTACL